MTGEESGLSSLENAEGNSEVRSNHDGPMGERERVARDIGRLATCLNPMHEVGGSCEQNSNQIIIGNGQGWGPLIVDEPIKPSGEEEAMGPTKIITKRVWNT